MSLCCLLQHKYTSIAEVQVHMEDEYLRSPFSGVSAEQGGMELRRGGWS